MFFLQAGKSRNNSYILFNTTLQASKTRPLRFQQPFFVQSSPTSVNFITTTLMFLCVFIPATCLKTASHLLTTQFLKSHSLLLMALLRQSTATVAWTICYTYYYCDIFNACDATLTESGGFKKITSTCLSRYLREICGKIKKCSKLTSSLEEVDPDSGTSVPFRNH